MLVNVSIKHSAINPHTGRSKIVVDHYIIEADSFTEAETIAAKVIPDKVVSGFIIKAAKFENFSEVINETKKDSPYYKVRVDFIEISEKTMDEKRIPFYYLTRAETPEEAIKLTRDHLDSSLNDTVIHTVAETNILEVIRDRKKN